MKKEKFDIIMKKYSGGKRISAFAFTFISNIIILYTVYILYGVYFTSNKVEWWIPYYVIGSLLYILYYGRYVIKAKSYLEVLEERKYQFIMELTRAEEGKIPLTKTEEEANSLYETIYDAVSQEVADITFFGLIPFLALFIELVLIIYTHG